jgi:SAM-dependent methyltransferase
MNRVLNVGGNDRNIPLPRHFAGWQHVLLDIDPRGKPDIVCDARELASLPGAQFEAVYCSHNLEHYHRHEVPRVLAGFLHVLKPGGFAHVRVPDMEELMRTVVEKNLDIDDVLYVSPAGPITVRDTIYGYGVEIERSGNDFYAHKTGFTRKSLVGMLNRCGFPHLFLGTGNFEIAAFAFRDSPSVQAKALLKLP